MKVVVQFGQIFLGDQVWKAGDLFETTPDQVEKLGSQVKAVGETPSPAPEQPKKPEPKKQE